MSWGLGLWYVRGYCCSVTNSYLTLCNPMDCRGQVSLSSITSRSLLKIMSIEPTRPSDHLILCRPRLYLPSAFPSIGIFYNESALRIRWLKYRNFSFSISSSNEYSGLISFRIDWFDLIAVQRTLKSLLQHHNLKASINWWSAFFMVQLSHLCMTTGEIIALAIWAFVSKAMFLRVGRKLAHNTIFSMNVCNYIIRIICMINWNQAVLDCEILIE